MNATLHAIDSLSQRRIMVVGLGDTGLSCVQFLCAQGCTPELVDTREQPPALPTIRQQFPRLRCHLGADDSALLADAELIVLSPGMARSHPLLAKVPATVPVIGDIELFATAVTAPVVAITGSNGKSTVTTLLGEMARVAGIQVAVGGNLGPPALTLLDPEVALYILELSSFQLETTASLRPAVATVLNLSPDHLDRYPDLATYATAKARIFQGAQQAVSNRDDPVATALADAQLPARRFGLMPPEQPTDWGLVRETATGDDWIACGEARLLRVADLHIIGTHNLANVLAALALGTALGLPQDAMLQAAQDFTGLAHRCTWVGDWNGVRWINDSKGTNPGATVSALRGCARPDGAIVLIAGGDGKGADFATLALAIREHCRDLILIGRDAPLLAAACAALPQDSRVRLHHTGELERAVRLAATLAQPGDTVLLSPACASFDQFTDYRHRGECFVAAVQEICG